MRFSIVLSLVILFVAPISRAQDTTSTSEELIDKIIKREHEVTSNLRAYHPLVETYAQILSRSNDRLVPKRDRYFLSVAEFSGDLRALRFKPQGASINRGIEESIDGIVPNSMEFDPSGFVAMAYPPPESFDRKHYRFQYAGTEFLGEVRCIVFDVHPISTRYSGMFDGRIWVEDVDFTIVRYNGIYKTDSALGGYFHFDSWRSNVSPGIWVPTIIYSEEQNLPCCGIWKLNWTKFRFKSQTRFWGYDLHQPGTQQELAKIKFDSSSPIQDQSDSSDTLGPVRAIRAWEREAEENLTEKLQRDGLLAPNGDVEKMLQGIINRIQVTNNLSTEPEVHCRVLLTSRLESIVVGHTIIVSRGLIDVMPNEATLASLFAHQLAHIQLGQNGTAGFAFGGRTMFSRTDAFRKIRFSHTDKQEKQASELALEWMTKSPYKDSLDSITQFAVELRKQAFHINYLLQSELGDSAYEIFGADRIDRKTIKATTNGQRSGLALESRILLDPWSGKLAFLRSEQETQSSAQILPFELAPVAIYLRRAQESHLAQASSEARLIATTN